MINLNFTEQELETLREYFQSELYKAEQQIDNIRGILDKIGKKQGKRQKTEKKTEKRGRKKVEKLIKAAANVNRERKRPGPKPKLVSEKAVPAEPKILKKRGRPAKVKPEVVVVNKKPGRPKKEKVVVAEKKAKPAKIAKKDSPKATPKTKTIKAEKKVARKKDTKLPTIPWGDWILTVLRDSENHLPQSQIFETISKRLQLNQDEFVAAQKKLVVQMGKLLKSNKIVMNGEGENALFSLKISGKGLR